MSRGGGGLNLPGAFVVFLSAFGGDRNANAAVLSGDPAISNIKTSRIVCDLLYVDSQNGKSDIPVTRTGQVGRVGKIEIHIALGRVDERLCGFFKTKQSVTRNYGSS